MKILGDILGIFLLFSPFLVIINYIVGEYHDQKVWKQLKDEQKDKPFY